MRSSSDAGASEIGQQVAACLQLVLIGVASCMPCCTPAVVACCLHILLVYA